MEHRADPLTVSAATDADADNGTATFSHTPRGGGYNGVAAASVVATEADDEIDDKTGKITVEPTALAIEEGGNKEYTVKLNSRPENTVEITVNISGDADFTTNVNSLVFTTANWNVEQTVTVQSAQDDDADDGTAIVNHSAASADEAFDGIPIDSVTLTELDDDTRGVTVAPTQLSVVEGNSVPYTMVLDTRPSGPVEVTVSVSGDTDISVNLQKLLFLPSNWNTAQTVLVSAAQDEDSDDGEATIEHSAVGGGYDLVEIQSVAVKENEFDARARLNEINSILFPEIVRAMSANALQAVKGRIEQLNLCASIPEWFGPEENSGVRQFLTPLEEWWGMRNLNSANTLTI